MSTKSDKFVQRIQDVKKFVAARIAQNSAYSDIAQELSKINDVLSNGKLNLQIYSRFPAAALALKHALSLSEQPLDIFQISTLPFPERITPPSSEPTASVLLTATTGQQTRYLLPSSKSIVIGRRPGCAIQLPDRYDRISGQHTEICPLPNQASPTWQVCELNNRNGTFVNGRKVQGCQTLEMGDRITLAYPSASEKAPELVFEGIGSGQLDEFQQQLEIADVLCLVVSSAQTFSSEEQRLIEIVSQSPLARCFVVIDTPKTGSDRQAENLSNAAMITSWLLSQDVNQSVELASLTLGLFDPERQGGTMLDPGSQPDLVQFSQSLNNLAANSKVEEQLIRRSTVHLLRQLARIEQALVAQETKVAQAIATTEQELASGSQSELKEQIRKAVRKANEERDKFFRQVKIDLNQSRNDLLDKHQRSSILNKIQGFVAPLSPVVTQRGGHTYLQLASPKASGTGEVNSALTHLCRSEIIRWGHEEWRKIGTSYAEGGYNAMLHRIYSAVNIVPSLALNDALTQPVQEMPIDRYLNASVVEFDDKAPYQQPSLAGYLLKSTKSQITSTLSTLAMIALAFGKQINGEVKASIIAILLPIVTIFLVHSYYQEKGSRLRDEGEKLKDKITSNYQDLAKSLIDRLKQAIDVRLDSEAQRLREATELVNEQLNTYAANLDKEQIQARTRLAEQKVRQTETKKERVELEKLKLI